MGDVSVYLFDAMDRVDAGFVARRLPGLPAFRRDQCCRYRHVADQATCLIAYALLAKGLMERYGLPRPEVFTYSETGKPSLGRDGVFFSLSHCRRGVACALSDHEVGIDIQGIRPFDDAVARRVCTDAELRRLAASPDPADLFCQMWTARESYGKALGTGVVGSLRQNLPATGFWHREGRHYWLTVYSTDPDARVVIHETDDANACLTREVTDELTDAA